MKMKFEHHSVSDWDFQAGTPFILSTGRYVSPPSSLYLYGVASPTVNRAILCRLPSCQVVAQGEVRCWFRSDNVGLGQELYFRNQAALGTANYNNGYEMSIRGTWAYFYYVLGGTGHLLDAIAITRAQNTWSGWRVVFWNGIQPPTTPALAVDLYEKVGGIWVKRGHTIYDTNNRWAASGINRLGIGCNEYRNQAYWHDDTELWGLP